MRLLLISIGTLSIAFVIGLIIRLWGLSLPYRPFEHPFFKYAAAYTNTTDSATVKIPVFNDIHFSYSPGTEPAFTPKDGLTKIVSAIKPQILWVNIYITADKKLISDYGLNVDAFLTWSREKNNYKGKYLHGYTSTELTGFQSKIIELKNVIDSFPAYQFIFNIMSNDLDIHKEIATFVDANTLSDRILINSPIDIIIKAVKQIRPLWVYGTSISEATRVKTFSSMHLEPAISVRGDVFVAPFSYLSRRLMDEAIVSEMKRRKKFVFIGPLVNPDEIEAAQALNPDGIIY